MNSLAAGDTTINFTYNDNGDLTKLAQQVPGLSNGTEMANEYGYIDEKVTAIVYNGFTYTFESDFYGNQTAVKIGALISVTDNDSGRITSYTADSIEIRSVSDNALLFSRAIDADGDYDDTIFGGTVHSSQSSAYTMATGATVDTWTYSAEKNNTEFQSQINSVKDWFNRQTGKAVSASITDGTTQRATSPAFTGCPTM
ncbi:MAG: hypothetical protein IJ766_00840 [Clostridia bacterium]|nr:hypothetical protein [Clostridia bacterium]